MSGLVLASEWFKQSDPGSAMIVMGIVGAAILIAIVAGAIRGNGREPREKASRTGGPRLFARFMFRSRLRAYGLSGEQVSFLDELVAREGITDPASVITDPKALDGILKRGFHEIDQGAATDAAAERNKALIFSIRQLLEAAQASGARLSSSRRLGLGHEFSFITEDESNYSSRILAADDLAFYAEIPKDPFGKAVDLHRGSQVTCFFYIRGGEGYTFTTKIRGIELRRGRQVMALLHSDAVKELPHRRHVRKRVEVSCIFYQVQIEDTIVDGKRTRKVVPGGRQLLGTINDISAGGCSIRSATPLRKGDHLRIEFDMEHGGTAAALGAIRKVAPLSRMGAMMHIQFTRMSQKTLNDILSRVYGY